MSISSLKSGVALISGAGLLVLSGFLGLGHAERIQALRETALPIAALLPSLEERLQVLTQQVELSELSHATTHTAPLERLHVFVLPKDQEVDRVVSLVDILRETLTKETIKNLSPIEFGESKKSSIDGVVIHPFTFDVTVTPDGLSTISDFFDIAGLMTVADAIPIQDSRLLVERTERENPAGLIALEEFLAMDLFTYARDPEAANNRLMKAFSSDQFTAVLQSVLQTKHLAKAVTLFQGPLGDKLESAKLWPVRFMTVDSMTMGTLPGDAIHLELIVHAYSREEE